MEILSLETTVLLTSWKAKYNIIQHNYTGQVYNNNVHTILHGDGATVEPRLVDTPL